jgi:FtsP/CotA-like multicopper oxidase with cupredoxin domain
MALGLAQPWRVLAAAPDGPVEVELEARAADLEIGGEPVRLLTYNGLFPGPLLRAREGQLLRVSLRNALDEPTNLHFHGLHVSPEGNSDNVFRELAPGAEATYELTVPEGHGGTFWYHPHRHHSLAKQLWQGLAGPIVIDPLVPPAPELAAAHEHVVVVKDLTIAGGLPAPHSTGDWARGKSGRFVLVNGQLRPTLEARSSPVRLRLVNACNARMLLLARGDGRPFQLIALEGHLLEAPQPLTEVLVTPAQRVDLLLELVPGERLTLVHKPYNRAARREPSSIEPLLDLAPSAAPALRPLPGQLRLVEPLEPGMATVTRRMRMAMAFMTPDGEHHMHAIRPRLGTVEHWRITNVDTQDHVFHLHTWPFQVWRRNGEPPPFPAWRDTINLRPGEEIELLIPFRRYAGKSLFHCHIAEHGDAGMMGIVEVVA